MKLVENGAKIKLLSTLSVNISSTLSDISKDNQYKDVTQLANNKSDLYAINIPPYYLWKL